MKQKLPIYSSIIAACILLISCEHEDVSGKIVFMNNVKVFEEFAMKIDYDQKIAEDLKEEEKALEEAQKKIQTAEAQKSDDVKMLKSEFFVAKRNYEDKFQNLSVKYTTEVNDRLNVYIKKYSEKHGYNILLGSGGQGNVMYVDESFNITDDLITYINKEYIK